jgi:hypothetical protein
MTFSDSQKIAVEGSSVDFFISNDKKIYYFDTSQTPAPEPMVNAMLGLKLIANTTNKLIMINHSSPNGLFAKISNNFDFNIKEREDEKYEITFTYKSGSTPKTDFNDNKCSG